MHHQSSFDEYSKYNSHELTSGPFGITSESGWEEIESESNNPGFGYGYGIYTRFIPTLPKHKVKH